MQLMLLSPPPVTFLTGLTLLGLCIITAVLSVYWLAAEQAQKPLQTYVVQLAFPSQISFDEAAASVLPGNFVCLYGQTNTSENGVYKRLSDSSLFLVQPLTTKFYGQIIVLNGEFANEVLWWQGPTQSMLQPIVTNAVTGKSQTEFNFTQLSVSNSATFVSDLSVVGLVDGVNVVDLETQLLGLPPSISSLTNGQVTQFTNIDGSTISNTQWGYVNTMNQPLGTAANVEFLTVAGVPTTFPKSVVEYTSSTNPITFPANTLGVLVEMRGGGGGGGGGGSSNNAGGGGGTGSVAHVWFTASDLSGHTGFAFTAGGGGAGASGSDTGVTGGDSELFFTDDLVTPLVTCSGGAGGGPGGQDAIGGLGGVASAVGGGYKNIVSNGTNGYRGMQNLSLFFWPGGNGGSDMKAFGGRGGYAVSVTGAPQAGQFGGGGGGGINGNGSIIFSGADGGDGYLTMFWY